MCGVRLAVATSVVLLGVATPAAAVDPSEFEKAYTEHLGQLVTAPGKGGVNELNNRANGSLGMPGTDLGVSFESRGRLYFLFGDSSLVFSGRPVGGGGGTLFDDSIAVTDARSADRFRMPRLSWAAGADGSFAPLRVPGASHGSFEVPVEGIHANGRTYVFFVSGWHSGSYDNQVLGHFDADTMQTGRFVFDQVVESSRFLNVSAVEYRGYVYLFGAGNPYRRSAVRLARFRAHAIDRPDQWRYLGQPLGDGRLAWLRGEPNAYPLVQDAPPCVGELSVRRDPRSGLFLMAYNCDNGAGPRGHYLRTARRPWGPWSEPIVMFDATAADGGYDVSPASLDRRREPTRRRPRRARPPPRPRHPRRRVRPLPDSALLPLGARTPLDRLRPLVLNPYKVTSCEPSSSRAGARSARRIAAPVCRAATIRDGNFDDGINGWTRLGTPFRVVTLENRHYASSYVPQEPGEQNGEDAQGALYQDFTLDNHSPTLCFRIHGGGVLTPGAFQTRNVASVRLYHNNEIVRESFGWNSDAYQDARWDIREFAGEPLRLMIADDATGPSGLLDATNFHLAAHLCAPARL